MRGNAEAAVPPYNNQRPRQRSAATADGRVRRRAQAGQHNEADSEPRTSWRVGAASQSAPLLVLLVTTVHKPANASSLLQVVTQLYIIYIRSFHTAV